MADNTNWEDLDDDDFMAAMEEAATADPIDNTEPEELEQEENIEDTDTEEVSEEKELEPESDEQIDDEVQDTGSETETDDIDSGGKNTQVDTDSENDGTQTDGDEEPAAEEQAKALNYEDEYKKILAEKQQYENFYNQVTGEFVANGKKVRGFDDPKKIIEAQQMAAGFSEKMASFKPFKPYMNALKDKGLLDNPEKFNLAMSLLDGDPEALKQQIKDFKIDPFEMDMENINYTEKNQVSNNIELALDDVMNNATQHGVDSQVRDVISKEWDDQSVLELLNDPQNSNDLVSHISSGAFDVVKQRMSQKKMTDVNGSYGNKSSIQQYREAANELENEYANYIQDQQHAQQQVPQQNVQANQNIVDQVKQTEYTKKVEAEKTKVDEARRKATSLSKRKRGNPKSKKKMDPLSDMDDEQFTKYMDSIIYQ